MKITRQQTEILDSVLKYKTIKINAFAGTGKTTTLKLIANQFTDKKILYLAFNTSIKNEASGIFPPNTNIKTTHGLAFSAIRKYTNIDLNNIVNYRAIDIAKEFEITYNQAIGVLKIFENFCNTTKKEIKKDDIEHKTAKKMFDLMLINKLQPTHSFYLKYYYLLLSSDQISQFTYDICMLDEAQDTNEVTMGIFEALSSKVKIYVGDKHQQIYSFRGSKNALNQIKSDKNLYLSNSFRFNSSIAHYANRLLNSFKKEQVEIDTLDNQDEKIETSGYISRTNAQLISIISKRIESRKPFVTVREPNEIFNLTIEVFYLLNNEKNKIKRNGFLKSFSCEEDILDYAKEVEDYELKSALKIVKEYGENIFEFKEISEKFYKAWQNRKNNQFDQRLKEILFLTTAHTAKGLEWDSVIVADDFIDFADLILDLGCDSYQAFLDKFEAFNGNELLDEFNLFYVALTRGRKQIIKDSENFHYLMANNLEKIIDKRIKDAKANLESLKNGKTKKATKLQVEDKQLIRQQKNLELGKAKNSGLKWSLEDKIKVKSMFNKDNTISKIASKLERTESAILGELLKSEVIDKGIQIELSQLVKESPLLAKKSRIKNGI